MIRKTTFFALATLFIMACASTQMPIDTTPPVPKKIVVVSESQPERAIISAPVTSEEVTTVSVTVPNTEPINDIVQGVEIWWTYTIQRGDTTFRLLKRCGSLTKKGEDAFLEKNGIANPNRIFAGAEVLLPCKLEPPQVATQAATVHEEPPTPTAVVEAEVSEVDEVFALFNEEDPIEELPQEEPLQGGFPFWIFGLAAAALLLVFIFRRKQKRR